MEPKIIPELQERLVKYFLDAIVLFELKKSNRLIGYNVIEFLHKKFGMLVSPGTIYSLLYSMERKGLIKGDHEEGKRTYMLTEKGANTIKAIIESKEEMQRFFQTLFAG